MSSELPFGSCAPNEFIQKRNGLSPSQDDTLLDVRKARRRKGRVKQSGNTAISVVFASITVAEAFFLLHPKIKENLPCLLLKF